MNLVISPLEENGLRKISLSEMETVCQRNMFWLLREMERAKNKKLNYNDNFIEEESYNKFAKWFNSNYENILPQFGHYNKRAFSSTHRIEVAYKQKYKCNSCNILLPPDETIRLYHPAFVKTPTPTRTPSESSTREPAPLTPSQKRALEYKSQAVQLYEAHGDNCY